MINSKFKIGQHIFWLTSSIMEGQIKVVEATEHLKANCTTHSTEVKYRLTCGHGGYVEGHSIFATKKEAGEAFMRANGLDCGVIA